MALVDQWGNGISSRTFLKAAENGGGRIPPQALRPLEPLRKLITQRDHQTVSFLSEKIFANFPLAEGIICQKSMHAVGNAWLPVFMGEDAEWGQEARRWLIEEWYPSCDVRGLNFDFVTDLYQGSTSIDYAGDLFEALIESENGWPQIQLIQARQIGQWETTGGANSRTKITTGKYSGLWIENGIIINEAGRPIAYRKLGEERGQFEDIPANYIVHTFEPKFLSQVRGLPLLSSALEDAAMSGQSEEWEQMAMLAASAISLIESNEGGEAPESEEEPFTQRAPGGSDPGPQIKVTSMLGGMIRYIKANSGQKMEQFVTQKPGDDWEKYQDRIARKLAVAANWSYGYAWKPESITTPGQRGELLKCRTAVIDRQALLRPRARRKLGWAISVAIKNGILPLYPGKDKGGFLKWDFTLPPKITIDEGRDRAQRREDSKAGLILDSTIVEEDGNTTYDDFCYKRARDVATREIARRKVEEETGIEIDPREMKMLTANDQAQESKPDPKEEKTDEK